MAKRCYQTVKKVKNPLKMLKKVKKRFEILNGIVYNWLMVKITSKFNSLWLFTDGNEVMDEERGYNSREGCCS